MKQSLSKLFISSAVAGVVAAGGLSIVSAATVFHDDFSIYANGHDLNKADAIVGKWHQNSGLKVQNGVVSNLGDDGKGASANGQFAGGATLGAGETLTLTFETAYSTGFMQEDSGGAIGVILKSGSGGKDNLFKISDIRPKDRPVSNEPQWSIRSYNDGGDEMAYTGTPANAALITFTYVYDTGNWTINIEDTTGINATSTMSGVSDAGMAISYVGIGGDNQGELFAKSVMVEIIPEPSTALLALGFLGLFLRRKR